MSDAELRALLRLRCVTGLGDVKLGRLLRDHGSAEALLALPASEIAEHGEQRDAPRTLRRVERVLRTIEQLELELFALHRPEYPARLRTLNAPPVLLFARGDSALLTQRGIGVVGTRRPTDYGVNVTEQLVTGMVQARLVIWSGGARGIDAAAHRTALAYRGGTVAVLGCGIDVVYPREHTRLFEEIAECGLLLSEFLPGEPPQPHNFPRRNRIIGRMPDGLLVVEARPDSGALITADHASESMPIMAVPGPVGRLTSQGPNRLIQDGAKLVMDVQDVLEELGGALNREAARTRPSAKRQWHEPKRRRPERAHAASPPRPSAGASQPELALDAPAPERLHAVLGHEGLYLDEIAARAGVEAIAALRAMLDLELAGRVQNLGGKRYRLPPPRGHTGSQPPGEGGVYPA